MDGGTKLEDEDNVLLQHKATTSHESLPTHQSSLVDFGTEDTEESQATLFDCLFDYLLNPLNENQEDQFIERFHIFISTCLKNGLQMTDHEWAQNLNKTLLIKAIWNGSNKAVELILQYMVADYSAIRIACIHGNRKALEMLLENNDKLFPNSSDLLDLATLLFTPKHLMKETKETMDFMGCLDVIFDSTKLSTINEILVMKAKTGSLFAAVVNKNEEAIMKFLDRGAYIDCISVRSINSEILEEYFDKCITTNGEYYYSRKFEIIINYINLIPWVTEQSEEMLTITQIATSDHLKHLLNHPLIASFLFLKWHKISFFFYVNFIVTLLFCICIILYIIFDVNDIMGKTSQTILKILSIPGLIYIIVREIIEFITLRKEKFSSSLTIFSNVVECMLIIMTILTLLEQQSTYALTILICSVEIYLLIGTLPIQIASIHMLMLKMVCESFVISFSQYLIFFITFGICFHLAFREMDNSNKDDGYFNSVLGSIFKIFIMTTGEFDFESINFKSTISYGIFILFVAFMAIVLLNLLNGLAVSDTQMIRTQAELNGSICRTFLLANLDRFLTVRYRSADFFKNIWPFSKIANQLTSYFEDYIHGSYISIRPNDGNKILIRKLKNCTYSDRPKNINDSVVIPIDDEENENAVFVSAVPNFLNCCSYFKHKCIVMDNKIVKSALAVIKKRQKIKLEQQVASEKKVRLKNVEKTREMILSLIQNSTQRF